MNLRKIQNFLTSKMMIVAYLILLQLFFLLLIVSVLSSYSRIINMILRLLSIVMVIYIINKDENPSYKLAWVIVIMTLPLFGGFLYLLFGGQKVPKALQRLHHDSMKNVSKIIAQDAGILDEIKKSDDNAHKQATYLWQNANFPVYKNTETKFIRSGEEKFVLLVQELKKLKNLFFWNILFLKKV